MQAFGIAGGRVAGFRRSVPLASSDRGAHRGAAAGRRERRTPRRSRARHRGGALTRMRDVVFDLGGVLIDWDPRYLLRDALGGEPAPSNAFSRGLHARMACAARPRRAFRRPDAASWRRGFPSTPRGSQATRRRWERHVRGRLCRIRWLVCSDLRARGYRLHALVELPGRADPLPVSALSRSWPISIRSCSRGSSVPEAAPQRSSSICSSVSARRACLFVDDRQENVAAAGAAACEAVHFVRSRGLGPLGARRWLRRMRTRVGADPRRAAELQETQFIEIREVFALEFFRR